MGVRADNCIWVVVQNVLGRRGNEFGSSGRPSERRYQNAVHLATQTYGVLRICRLKKEGAWLGGG